MLPEATTLLSTTRVMTSATEVSRMINMVDGLKAILLAPTMVEPWIGNQVKIDLQELLDMLNEHRLGLLKVHDDLMEALQYLPSLRPLGDTRQSYNELSGAIRQWTKRMPYVQDEHITIMRATLLTGVRKCLATMSR